MKLAWLVVILCLSGRADVIFEKKRLELKTRCFIWKPEACGERHRKADQELIARIQAREPSLANASREISSHARSLLKSDAIQAIYRFNQALILDATNAEAWWGAGRSYEILAMTPEAAELFQKASDVLDKEFSKSRGNGEALFLRAEIALGQGKVALAKSSYQKALSQGMKPNADFEARLK